MDFASSGEVFSANVIALPLALAGGVVAGINPCCLALYPAAASACCCGKEGPGIKPALGNAIAFVLGIAVSVTVLGLLAVYVGRASVTAAPLQYAIAFLPLLMGVYKLGWIELPLPAPRALQPGVGGAFGAGLLLSLVVGPCGTPILASVLSFAANERSFLYGGLLLFVYGIGNGLPLLLVATATGGALQRLEGSRFGHRIDTIVGGLLLLLGFYLLWRI